MPLKNTKTDHRITREKQTVEAMIRFYCRAHHTAPGRLCGECSQLLQYAISRLDRCPYGGKKSPCARCPTHCYDPSRREQIKQVMRFAGPRMLWRHPLLAIRHQWDSLRCALLSP